MSNPSPSKLGPPRWPARRGIQQSACSARILKSLERTIRCARYENFIGGQWVAPVRVGTLTTSRRRPAR